jgi:hypothetical protein
MEGLFHEEDPTPPMGLAMSDRMILEAAIRGIHALLQTYIEEQREQTAKFYSTRMMPLEAQVVKLTTIAWFALGIAVSALFVGAIVLIALIAR